MKISEAFKELRGAAPTTEHVSITMTLSEFGRSEAPRAEYSVYQESLGSVGCGTTVEGAMAQWRKMFNFAVLNEADKNQKSIKSVVREVQS